MYANSTLYPQPPGSGRRPRTSPGLVNLLLVVIVLNTSLIYSVK